MRAFAPSRLRSFLSHLRVTLQGRSAATAPISTNGTSAVVPTEPPSGAMVAVAGTSSGWLRVLEHPQLLQAVQAERALREIWRQSRLSADVWQRDCLPAVQRYAEFVQLMPASEAHHHAHAGGLLSHTIEMLLAAMTWRNGHFLPAGAAIESIDANRDEWTYVVFFSALLHDVAKPMTDLRISWRNRDLADPLRWIPMAALTLNEMGQGKADAEYLVEFMPKSQRDYGAHSRLAMMLLPRIVPPSALHLLARQPAAFEALENYLNGHDTQSLVAQIVRKADRASTQRALLSGNRARFATASAVPLIDLLMQAIGSMLRAGTSLPLNRSGAAGWVFNGAVWFVAKRIADSVRTWIKTNAPEESIPGETKNDRLFDTWQEYGCIEVNPQSGQAVWYVTVHGKSLPGESDGGATDDGSPEVKQGAYSHSLTMLRFPLSKLYADASQYPPEMLGHIEVQAKRKPEMQDGPDEAAAGDVPTALQTAPASRSAVQEAAPTAAEAVCVEEAVSSTKSSAKPKPASTLKEPTFNKPKPAKVIDKTSGKLQETPAHPAPGVARTVHSDDAFLLSDAAPWLDADDDVSAAVHRQARSSRTAAGVPKAEVERSPESVPTAASRSTGAVIRPMFSATVSANAKAPPANLSSLAQGAAPVVHGRSGGESSASDGQDSAPHQVLATTTDGPVVLPAQLPAIRGHGERVDAPEPSSGAIEFMRWIQHSLATRQLKFNETGAAVHFTPEGMALVSPLIFKLYAATIAPEAQAQEHGLRIQREVIKAGWHMLGPNKTNILSYEVRGRGGASKGRLSAVVLVNPERWVLPVPPSNSALRLV